MVYVSEPMCFGDCDRGVARLVALVLDGGWVCTETVLERVEVFVCLVLIRYRKGVAVPGERSANQSPVWGVGDSYVD